jgi:hypothetical protein
VPGGSGEVVVITSGGGVICKVNARLAVAPTLSVTWAVKLNVPIWVGVPLIAPVEGVSDNPGGSEPALNDQL